MNTSLYGWEMGNEPLAFQLHGKFDAANTVD